MEKRAPAKEPLDDAEVFRRRATNAGFWWQTGENLLTAADTLWSQIGPAFQTKAMTMAVETTAFSHRDAYFLVAGCAVEALLKAVRVAQLFRRTGRQAHLEMPEPKLPPGFKNNHDLKRLAGDAGFELSYQEAEILRRLSIYIRWAARYPVPTKPGPRAPGYVAGSDHERVHAFVQRLRAEYDALPRQTIMSDGSF